MKWLPLTILCALLCGPVRAKPPQPTLLNLAATWHHHTLTISVASEGCLRLIGGGRRDAELPGSCGVGTYTISPQFLDADYTPQGRVVVLRDYAGTDRAWLVVPPDPGYVWLPVIVKP